MTAAVEVWSARGVDQMTLDNGVTAAVAVAVDGVRRAFSDTTVHAWPDAKGGAFVVIDTAELSPALAPSSSWLGFLISYLHPETDCYPHYVRPDLHRVDGRALQAPFHNGQTFDGLQAVMVSRRSPGRDPRLDTPARKTLSVLQFIRDQS